MGDCWGLVGIVIAGDGVALIRLALLLLLLPPINLVGVLSILSMVMMPIASGWTVAFPKTILSFDKLKELVRRSTTLTTRLGVVVVVAVVDNPLSTDDVVMSP